MPGMAEADCRRGGAAPRQRRPRVSFETLLAGRAMPIAGLLLVLLAAAFFLDQAFRNGWIGPLERIVLGLVVGSALIFVAARRIGAEYTFLAEGLIGLGAGILYLSLWAAVAKFPELHVSRPAVFAAMIAVTAVLSVLASTRRSERLALMGMFGGFITPLLLANGPPDRAVLAAYLLILAGAMLWVSVRSSFRFVEALTFVAVVCYAPAFAVDTAHHWGDVQCAVVATLFFAAFGIAFTLGALRDGAASNARVMLLASNVVMYALRAGAAVRPKQTTLGIILLVLAAVLLGATRVPALPRRLQVAYAYLGLAAVTLAIPALFHATSLIDVFAVEAALLVAVGVRSGDRWVLAAGAVLFFCTGFALFERRPPRAAAPYAVQLALVRARRVPRLAGVRADTPCHVGRAHARAARLARHRARRVESRRAVRRCRANASTWSAARRVRRPRQRGAVRPVGDLDDLCVGALRAGMARHRGCCGGWARAVRLHDLQGVRRRHRRRST